MFEEFGQRHLHWAAVNHSAITQNTSLKVVPSHEIQTSVSIETTENNDTAGNGNNNIKIVNDEYRLPQYFTPDLLSVKIDNSGTSMIGNCEVITHFYLTRVKDETKQKEISSKFPFVKFGRPKIKDILKEAKHAAKEDSHSNCYGCCS